MTGHLKERNLAGTVSKISQNGLLAALKREQATGTLTALQLLLHVMGMVRLGKRKLWKAIGVFGVLSGVALTEAFSPPCKS